ncbi:MAG: CPBP family intramembrane metalloprotease [Gemmatimonadetes bacterium]|nr:CPBP family intramembrane metalloprotease [Gemmatimonadota bacterium]
MNARSLLWVLIPVGALAVFVALYDRVFPTAAVDLRVTRAEAEQMAEAYLRERGFDLEGYTNAVTFEGDDLGAVYLQRTVGLEQMNALTRAGTVPIWYWRARWFRPLQKEEYAVRVLPEGRVLALGRVLEEDKAGANLEQEEARGIAETFLEDAGIALSEYDPVEASSERRKARTDHTFVWKQKGFQAGDSELRLRVEIQGDQVGAFTRFLKVPESFERGYHRERAVGGLIAAVMVLVLTLALAVASFVVFLRAYKANALRWRFALGFAGLLIVLEAAAFLNMLPQVKAGYNTEVDYAVFWGGMLVGGLLLLGVLGLWVLLGGGAGEVVTREMYPHSLRTLNDLLQRRLTRELAVSSLRGYALASGFLGYVVILYLVGRRFFDVWLPVEGPYTNILNTAAPFLFPLAVGVTAAITEEFAYRFFAIPFLKRHLRSTFLALLLPAMIWGFGHSTYPVFPVYVRGIELTIVGLAFGYFFIRYDLWTVLVAHYAIDAALVGLPLLKSGNTYFQVSGSAVILLGLLPAFAALIRLRRPAANRSRAQPSSLQ